MTDDRQALSIRFDRDRYEWMRKVAYEQHRTLQSIIEDAVDLLRHTPAWLDGSEDEDRGSP